MRHALFALALLVACKSGGSSTQPKGAGGSAGSETPRSSAGSDVEGPADARGKTGATNECASLGRPWDGKPKDCPYEHEGCCYDAAEAACAAAGCAGPQCVVMESYPAQVRCDASS